MRMYTVKYLDNHDVGHLVRILAPNRTQVRARCKARGAVIIEEIKLTTSAEKIGPMTA